jgi:hypothetical protein
MVIYANKPILIETFDDVARKLMDTRLLRLPVQKMKERIDSLIEGTDNKN